MKGLKFQKRIASSLLKGSRKRVKFDSGRLEEIKESITRGDIRSLVGSGAIALNQKKGVSRARAKLRQIQKTKGLRKGPGKRKGKATARTPRKENWIKKIRSQRNFIGELKKSGLISSKTYRDVYSKSKGGFFRSKRHIKLYLNENKLFLEK